MLQVCFTKEGVMYSPVKIVLPDGTEHLASTDKSLLNMIDFPDILGPYVGESIEIYANDELERTCVLQGVGTTKKGVGYFEHS